MDFSQKSWMQKPAAVPEEKILQTVEADIVILGAGYSGTAAARAAMEAGASVIVVEQQQRGRFDCYGAQCGTVNSKFMLDRGAEYVDPVDIIADWQRRSLNRAQPELVRQFAYHSGEAFDWFIDILPQEIIDSIEIFMSPKPKYFTGELNGYRNYVGDAMFCNTQAKKMGAFPGGPGGPGEGPDGPGGPGQGPGGPAEGSDAGGPDRMPNTGEEEGGNGRSGPGGFQPMSLLEAMEFTHEYIEQRGVRFFYGITGEQLEQDDTGRVVALLGHNYKKEYTRFLAKKGVILAAGDFSGNKEMVMDLLTEYADLTGNGEKYAYSPAGRKGKGIQMGLWAGGVMEPGPRGGMWCCVGGAAGPMDGSAFLRLNKYAKRYTNEGIMGYWGAGLQGARQPKGPIYAIWDSNWEEELQCQTLDHTAVEVSERSLGGIRMQLEQARKQGKMVMRSPGPPGKKDENPDFMVCADTLDELADLLGLSGETKQTFLSQIERYNELARLGKDLDFAKDPRQLHPIQQGPFYAYCENNRKVGFLMVTVAGLNTDGAQQVLNKDDEPIAGLFATGNCCGNRFPMMYTTPVSGVSIGIAMTLGRIVGDHVAGLQ